MTKLRLLLILLSAALTLTGCSTLSESECAVGNWYQIGFKDGKRGKDSDYVIEHESSCAEYGVFIDREEYEQGRQRGLDQYCVGANGYQRGSSGSYPNQSCSQRYVDYHQSYYDGLLARYDSLQITLEELHKEHEILRQVIRRIDDEEEIERLNLELDEIDDDIDSVQSSLTRTRNLLDRFR
ncbi:DUF2799 domain-containing protein [Kangiella marina]|uniref:DUF2799 domain-containing protein n=1 Tax=Kangiella marina TaxID=1079178 RepID=A0ABP8ILT4_9GAMM